MPLPTHTPKYRAGDMVAASNAFFYIISVTSKVKQGISEQIYLTRIIDRTNTESDIRSIRCESLDKAGQMLGNYPAYNWKKFLLQGDPVIESQVQQSVSPVGTTPIKGKGASQSPLPLPKQKPAPAVASAPTSTAGKLGLKKAKQMQQGVANPIVPTPWMYQFVNPNAKPKAPAKATNECECGSFKVGITSRGYGHSDWCPMYKEKKG